jgi:alkylation response protein AidB-like acyl-CoA dehydrogenase
VELHLSDEQRLLRDEAREVLARHCRPADLERWRREGCARPPELWKRLADLGWLGFAIAEADGGLGADFVDLALLTEACGRALVPALFAATTGAALAIATRGAAAQRARYLPAIARGEATATLAVTEPDAVYDLGRIATALTARDGGYALAGRKALVEGGADADLLVVAARWPVVDGARGHRGRHDDRAHHDDRAEHGDRGDLALVVVPRATSGVRVTHVATFDDHPAADVVLADVAVPGEAVLGGPGDGRAILENVMQRLTTLLCAEMVGGLERVLELTAEYVKGREQFGRPIGSFQAVQHALADVATALEGARYATYQAAWRLARGLPATREVAIAKAWTSPAYKHATLTAHQLHGGMGFVTEYPLHLYSSHAKACEARLGPPDRHLETVAGALAL